jgi:hypothetical protein
MSRHYTQHPVQQSLRLEDQNEKSATSYRKAQAIVAHFVAGHFHLSGSLQWRVNNTWHNIYSNLTNNFCHANHYSSHYANDNQAHGDYSAPPRTTPPTVEELTEEHFLDPEIPRITAEQIKMIIDAAQAAGEYAGSGGMISWDNFVIIDTRSSKGEVLGAPGFNQPGHILGARSMPMTWYWVTDPREDPKPEELQAYQLELDALENNITQLPKDLPIYIYDGTADDEAACIVARMILEAGFNPDNVKVIWKGFAYWYYDLRYPIVQGDYNFEGE